MKTEQRHELKKNELTEILVKIEPYWRTMVGGLVVLITVVLVFSFFSASQKKAREAGWSTFFTATANRDPEALQTLAASQKGNAVAPWAQYSAAQGKLIEGSAAMATDRAAAKLNLQEAVAGFKDAIEQAGNYELIQERALWGMAQAHENLDELSSAKDYYKQIVDSWPGSAIAQRAQARIDNLNDPATQDFYKWYFAQTPPAASLPSSGNVPGLPFGELPTSPDVTIPDPTAGGTGGSDPGTIDLQLPYSNTDESGADDAASELNGPGESSADGDSAPDESIDFAVESSAETADSGGDPE